MYTKRKKHIAIFLGAVVFGLSLILQFALNVNNVSESVHANRNDSEWLTIDEIYNEEYHMFSGSEVEKLYYALTGKNTYDEVKESLIGGALASSEFYAKKENNKNIEVNFGGMKWDAVYLTTSREGDLILDLWKSSDTLKESDWIKFKDRSGSDPDASSLYPDNMYSTSLVRVSGLNAGGYAATSIKDLKEKIEQDPSNQYARFTMSKEQGVENSLLEYIAKPSEVSYQESEWDENVAQEVSKNNYYFPNDAYGEVVPGGKWYSDDFNYGNKNRDELRQNGVRYDLWKDDYLWLPSISEVGVSDNSNGIWKTDVALRSCNIVFSSSYDGAFDPTRDNNSYWLRTGSEQAAWYAYKIHQLGGQHTDWIDLTGAARPALHLNLKKVTDNSGIDMLKGDTKAYHPNGVTWDLSYLDSNLMQISPKDEGMGVSFWNADTKIINAKNVGKYTLKVTPKGDAKNWFTGGNEEKEIVFEVVKAKLEARYNFEGSMKQTRDKVFQVNDPGIELKLPQFSDASSPIYYSNTNVDGRESIDEKLKINDEYGEGLKITYVVQTHDEAKHDKFQKGILSTLESLKISDEWKEYEQLPIKVADKPNGYCVFYKIEDPQGRYETYYNYFVVHIFKEELEISISQEAREGYSQGEVYGYSYGSRKELRDGLINSIQKITMKNDGMDEDRTEPLKRQFNNFHFYLRTEDGYDKGTRYDFGEDGFLKGGEKVKYLPVGTYYLYIYYTDSSSEELTNENNGCITFTWEGGRPSFQVSKRKLVVKANDSTIKYGDVVKGNDVTYSSDLENPTTSGFAPGEDKNVLNGELIYTSKDYNQFDDIGEYTITPSGLESSNYEFEYKDGVLHVKQKEISVDFKISDEYTYGDDLSNINPTLSGVLNNDQIGVKLSYENGKQQVEIPSDAGNYKVSAILTGEKAKNYKLTNDFKSFVINKADITASLKMSSIKYDGTSHEAEIEFKGLKKQDEFVKDVDYIVSYELQENGQLDSHGNPLNVGKYKVVITILNENYKLANQEDLVFEITINDTIIKPSGGFDGLEKTFTYNGKFQGFKISNYDENIMSYVLKESDSVKFDPKTGIFEAKDVGTYELTINLDDGYSWEGGNSITYKITIKEKDISADVNENDKSIEFNGQNHDISINFAGLENNETLIKGEDYTITIKKDRKECEKINAVGDYEITITLSLNGKGKNYNLTNNTINIKVNVSLVNDKPTVDLNGKDGSFTYSGQEQGISINGYDPNKMEFTLGRDEGATFDGNEFKATNAGTYILTISLKNGYQWGEGGDVTITLKIIPYELTLSWSMNDYTYNGEQQINPTATAQGANGEEVTIIVSIVGDNQFKNAGKYEFIASVNDNNYVIKESDKMHEYNIKKADISVELEKDSAEYTGSEIDNHIIFEGLKGNNLVEDVDYKVAISGNGLVNGKPLEVGTYIITIELLNSELGNDYNLINNSVTFTIIPDSVIDPNNNSTNPKKEIDATFFVLLFLLQFIIGICALLFVRRRRAVTYMD